MSNSEWTYSPNRRLSKSFRMMLGKLPRTGFISRLADYTGPSLSSRRSSIPQQILIPSIQSTLILLLLGNLLLPTTPLSRLPTPTSPSLSVKPRVPRPRSLLASVRCLTPSSIYFSEFTGKTKGARAICDIEWWRKSKRDSWHTPCGQLQQIEPGEKERNVGSNCFNRLIYAFLVEQ